MSNSNNNRFQVPGGVPLLGAQHQPSPQDIYNNIFMQTMSGVTMNAEAWRLASSIAENTFEETDCNKVLVQLAEDLAIAIAAKVGINVQRNAD